MRRSRQYYAIALITALAWAVGACALLPPVGIESSVGLEPRGTNAETVRRSPAQAAGMILDYLQGQKPNLNPDTHLAVEELSVPQAWDHLHVQVFRITDGPFANESFLIGDAGVLAMGTAVGGRGLASVQVSDLDRDGSAELLFTYGFGSGIHQSRIGMYAPAHAQDKIYEATTGYLRDLALVEGDMSTVRVRVVESDGAASTGRYLDTLGQLAIKQNNGDVELVLQLADDLSDEVRQNVFYVGE